MNLRYAAASLSFKFFFVPIFLDEHRESYAMKMKFEIIVLVAALSFQFSTVALACQFDTDCNVGSRCEKDISSIYGVCVGGMNPGNANDRQPVYDPLDLNRGFRSGSTGDARGFGQDSNGTYGDTCSFDTDCGIGSRCVKENYSITGTCS